MCWCLVVQLDAMDDPGNSVFPLLRCCIKCSSKLQSCCIKCSPTSTGMFVVFLNVNDLHLLGVLGFGRVARYNG